MSDNVLCAHRGASVGLGSVTLTAADAVTLADTGGHIAALTATQFGQLHTEGVDVIDSTSNALSLSLAQYQALGTTTLTQTDTIVLKDTGAADRCALHRPDRRAGRGRHRP